MEEDISADTATNQAIESVNSCPDGNTNNLPQAKESVNSGPDIAATPAIDSDDSSPDTDATPDIESDNSCSDDNAIPSQDEASADVGPDDMPVNDNSEQASNFDSEMLPILNLQNAGLRRSPRIAAQKTRPWYK